MEKHPIRGAFAGTGSFDGIKARCIPVLESLLWMAAGYGGTIKSTAANRIGIPGITHEVSGFQVQIDGEKLSIHLPDGVKIRFQPVAIGYTTRIIFGFL